MSLPLFNIVAMQKALQFKSKAQKQQFRKDMKVLLAMDRLAYEQERERSPKKPPKEFKLPDGWCYLTSFMRGEDRSKVDPEEFLLRYSKAILKEMEEAWSIIEVTPFDHSLFYFILTNRDPIGITTIFGYSEYANSQGSTLFAMDLDQKSIQQECSKISQWAETLNNELMKEEWI
jgi:hypothetical protein